MRASWGSRAGMAAWLTGTLVLLCLAGAAGVANAAGNLSVSGTPVSAHAGIPFSGQVATITDSRPGVTASELSATITWGDGGKSAGTVTSTGNPGEFTVSSTHTWSAPGTYSVRTAVQDTATGEAAAAGSTATVSGSGGGSSPRSSLAVLTPHPAAGELVTFSGASSAPGSGRIISYDWDFNGDGHIDTSTGTNPTSHFILPPGLHTIGLTITNSNGQQSTSHSSFVVASPPISVPVPDGGQGECKPSYDDGNVHIIAECIQPLSGGGVVIETHQLDLNGMTLVPKGGGFGVYKILPFKEFGIGSGTQLSGTPSNDELLNTPIGDMVLGGQDLSSDPITLTFQAFTPPHALHFAHASRKRAGAAGTKFSKTLLMNIGVGKSCSAGSKDPSCCPPTSTSSACATLPGNFPLTGQFSVYLDNTGQTLYDVEVGLDLSAVNFQATGALEIVADIQTGIHLSSLQFNIGEAGLASVFEVKNASFAYYFPDDPDPSKRDSWQAKATFIFGPLSQPSLAAELDFQHGDFHFASMLFTAPSGTGVPIYPGILLNQLGGSVGVNPLQFGGQLGASIAEELELSLAFKYREPTDSQLGFFGGQGTLSLSSDKIATLAADVYSDGYTDAQLAIDLHFPFDSNDPVVRVFGDIGFWDEPSSGRWEADGDFGFKLWVISAEVAGLVNDQYAAGCADVAGFGVQGRYRFADGNIDGGFFGFSNCSDQLKQYKEMPVTPHTGGFVGSARYGAHAAASGGGTVKLPGHTSGEELVVSSSAGSPVVTVTGPDHKTYTTPAKPGQISTSGGAFISAISPDPHKVLIFLRRPAGGKWDIEPVAGSATISSVTAAQDVPPAKIRVRVRHLHGHRFLLRYRTAHYVKGTTIQFVQRGHDSTNVIGTVRRAKGSLHFAPQDAIARNRTIFAYLRTTGGAPLRTIRVAKFKAPPATRPGRLRSARFARRGTTAVLSWKRAQGVRQYRVLIHGSDGRVISAFPPAGQRRLVVPQVLPTTGLSATVVPLGGANMLPGRGAHTKLPALGNGRAVVLSCRLRHGRRTCNANSVSGAVSVTGLPQATLSRGGAVFGRGIASDLHTPKNVALNVDRPVAPGRYKLIVRRHRRTVHFTVTVR